MAFTQVTLTGAVDTIKEGFTKLNGLITDLAAVTSGKGASQIGILDTALNMDATNVETGLAEIYTDTASARALADAFDENPATTTGLTWGYKAGVVRSDNVVTAVTAGTVSLTDDAINYLEVDGAGNVSRNTTGFTSQRIPLRQVTAASGVQTASADKRAWFSVLSVATTTAKTEDYTLTPSDLNGWKTFTNDGATAEVNFTWPTLTAGQGAYFYVADAYYLRVTAPTGKKFRWGGKESAAAGYIRCATVGGWIYIKVNTTDNLSVHFMSDISWTVDE